MEIHMLFSALPAMKGHSERSPDKNIRDSAGNPLFRWLLDTLIASPLVEEVIITQIPIKI
jgi:CMP-N-acetylneuraminic acid synthetase